jgi:hypothetical protein
MHGDDLIEVQLRQPHMQITFRVVREDGSAYDIYAESTSIRGAQREITGKLIKDGYQPLGRWDGTVRRYRRPLLGRIKAAAADAVAERNGR